MSVLRELEVRDAQAMLECMSDKDVNQFMRIDGTKMQLNDCINFINHSNNMDNINFAIVNEIDMWVGTISLKNIDREVGQAEYAIITSKNAHGTGIAFKATKEILSYAFDELNLKRVYLNVIEDNIRANKFYKKVGFEYEGTFRCAIKVKGKIYNLNWYSIINKG